MSDMKISSGAVLDFWKNNSRLKNIYPKRPGKGEYPENKKVFDILVNLIDTDTVLEYGCGYGRLAHLFNDKNYIGIDINKYGIEKAKHRHPDKIFIHIDDNFIFPAVETVFAYTVFHHIPIDILHTIFQNMSGKVNNLIIAEMMDGISNLSRMPSLVFRGVTGYKNFCSGYNFQLIEEIHTPHGAKKDRPITFLKFKNVDKK